MRQPAVFRLLPNLSTIALCAYGCAGSSPATEDVAPSALVVYRPFEAMYQATTHRTIQQEFDGQVVTTESGMTFFLRTSVVESDSLLSASFVLDSVARVVGLQGPLVRAQLDSARTIGPSRPTTPVTESSTKDALSRLSDSTTLVRKKKVMPDSVVTIWPSNSC